MTHIHDQPDLAKELDAHLALKATTDGWVERLALDKIEDEFAAHPVARIERTIGVSLLLGGTSLLAGFGLVELMMDPLAPLWVKGGTTAVIGGLAILLFSVVRWRLATRKSDKYTEVMR